jgi:radical SAM protein with 4Fe4S-binding SPASM domain
MYVQLSEECVLRGWKDNPFAIYDTVTGEEIFLPSRSLLFLLEGEADADLVFLTPAESYFLDFLIKRGHCRLADRPAPLGHPRRYRKSEGVHLKGVQWSITGKCNLRCKHCYISAPEGKYEDLDTETCLALIKQMAAANAGELSLTGGEPLLRQDFWQLADAALAEGIRIVSIYTNGLLLDDAFFKNMKKRNISFRFVVSFDGTSYHDWMRGIEGTEEKTVAAIRRIRNAGYPVAVNMMIHGGNLKSLLPTYETLKDLDALSMRVSTAEDIGNWRRRDNAPLPPERLFEEYMKLVRRFLKDGRPLSLRLSGFYYGSPTESDKIVSLMDPREMRLNAFACPSMREYPYLLPDGRLLPCPMLADTFVEANMPNLLRTPLANVYSDTKGNFFKAAETTFADVVSDNRECADCEYVSACGGGTCRAAAAIQGKSLRARDKRACEFFKGGWRQRLEALLAENAALEKIQSPGKS